MEILYGRREWYTYVDMTVEEPWTWVICLEADADLRAPNTNDIAARGVDKVGGPIHTLDDMESMTMKMNGVHCGL